MFAQLKIKKKRETKILFVQIIDWVQEINCGLLENDDFRSFDVLGQYHSFKVHLKFFYIFKLFVWIVVKTIFLLLSELKESILACDLFKSHIE